MIADVAIIGSELDAYIASIRLKELGLSSNIISNGKGSYLYSQGNIKILDYHNLNNESVVLDPFNFIKKLPENHPYRIIGGNNVFKSVEWFLNNNFLKNLRYSYEKKNSYTISPIGIKIPSYAIYFKQLDYDYIYKKNITIVNFSNHRDFHPNLIAKSLLNHVNTLEIIDIPPPNKNQHSDNSSIALSFDKYDDLSKYFLNLKKK